MFCPKCGVENTDSAAFCKSCGAEIRNSKAESSGKQTEQPKAEKAKQNKGIVIAGVSVVALVAIGLGGFGVYKAFFEPYQIDQETFPDQTFREFVASNFDADGDGKLSRSEAGAVEYIGMWDEQNRSYSEPISKAGVTSFEGIGCFSNLKGLVANGNINTELDLSKNKKLEYVVMNDGSLEKLDVSGCSNLQDVWISPDAEVVGLRDGYLTAHLITSGDYYLGSASTYDLDYVYSLDGKLLQSTRDDGDSETCNSYEYDKDNKLVKSTTVSDYSTDISTYEYDDQQRLVSIKTYNGDTKKYFKTLSYDSQGRVSSLVSDYATYKIEHNYSYNDKNLLTGVKYHEASDSTTYCAGTFSFEYDESGNMTSVTAKTTEGQGRKYKDVFAYDEAGRLVSEGTWSEDGGTFFGETKYEYSEDGKSCKSYWVDSTAHELTEYDDAGRIACITYSDNNDGEVFSQESYTYTQDGLLVKSTEEINPDSTYGSTYSFNFRAIAHYGKTPTTTTVQLDQFFRKSFEPESGSYWPNAARFIDGYDACAIGVNLPYPANLRLYLSA